MPNKKRSSKPLRRVKRRKTAQETWPNLQFNPAPKTSNLPFLLRLVITCAVLVAIALAVELWYSSHPCMRPPANPEGQPQAHQLIPPSVRPQHRSPVFTPPIFRRPAKAAMPVSKMDLIVFRKSKKQPMVLMPRRSPQSSVKAEILDGQGQILKTLDKPAGKAGRVRLEWDGTDVQGKPLPDGKYLVRTMSAEGEDTKALKVMP